MKFLNANEIIADILANMSEEDKKYFGGEPKKHVNAMGINEHGWIMSSFGRFIRNEYNLWHKDNPFTMMRWTPEMRFVEFVERNGQTDMVYSDTAPYEGASKCDCSPYHPDNFSSSIRDAVIAKLKSQ